MSYYIREIVEDIKNSPKTWKRYGENGLQKNGVIIKKCGNGSKYFMLWLTSIAEVEVNGKGDFYSTSWSDKYRIEEAFLWWMRNASVEMLRS